MGRVGLHANPHLQSAERRQSFRHQMGSRTASEKQKEKKSRRPDRKPSGNSHAPGLLSFLPERSLLSPPWGLHYKPALLPNMAAESNLPYASPVTFKRDCDPDLHMQLSPSMSFILPKSSLPLLLIGPAICSVSLFRYVPALALGYYLMFASTPAEILHCINQGLSAPRDGPSISSQHLTTATQRSEVK